MNPAHNSLERLVPDQLSDEDDTGLRTFALHLERYEFAARHLGAGRVLDMACGVGYGTRLMADRSDARVLGVDLSEEAIGYAKQRYGGEDVEFRAANAMSFEDSEGFDAIVSLETIEHLEDPDAFLARVVSLLHPGGLVIGSVPTTPSVDLNPHHRHDFTERSFRRRLAAHGLREIDCLRQVQSVRLGAVLGRREQRMSDLRTKLPVYYAHHPSAFLRRIGATLRYGFTNRYITIAWQCSK